MAKAAKKSDKDAAFSMYKRMYAAEKRTVYEAVGKLLPDYDGEFEYGFWAPYEPFFITVIKDLFGEEFSQMKGALS